MAKTAEDEASRVGGGSDSASDAGAAGGTTADGGLTLRLLAWEALPIWLTAFVVYMLTLSLVPALTHDSLTYVNSINDGGLGLWHPHHLVYNAMGAAWLRFVRSLGVESGGLRVVASINAVFGATSAALCYALLRDRARTGRLLALAGTVGAAASFGFWFYSVSVEVYALPLMLLLATLYVLLSPRLTGRHVLAVGLLNGLAVLGHQINVLFVVVVVVVLARTYRRVGAATLRRWLVAYAAVAGSVVVVAYGLVMWLAVKPDSTSDAFDWFTRYAKDDNYWAPPSASTLPSATFGASRAIVGGHFLFRFEWVRDQLAKALPGKSLTDEAFLVRNLSPVLAGLLAVAAVIGGGLLAVVVVNGIRRRGFVTPPARALLVALVAWIVTYSLFFLVWEPTNVEFWIPQVTCLWLAAAALCARPDRSLGAAPAGGTAEGRPPAHLRPGGDRWAKLLLAAGLLVGVTNLAVVLPATDPANDIYAYRFKALGTVVGPGDAVVVDRPHLSVGYNRRSTAAGAIPAEPYSEAVDPSVPHVEFSPVAVLFEVQAVLDTGHRVAVAPSLMDEPPSGTAEEVGDLLKDAYGKRWTRVEPAPGVEWLVIEPP